VILEREQRGECRSDPGQARAECKPDPQGDVPQIERIANESEWSRRRSASPSDTSAMAAPVRTGLCGPPGMASTASTSGIGMMVRLRNSQAPMRVILSACDCSN
jgi:hypothetical protein